MNVRAWLSYFLCFLAVVALGTHAVAIPWAKSHSEGSESMFLVAAVCLPALILVNAAAARWRVDGQPVLGPFFLAGVTLPTVALVLVLSWLAVSEVATAGGLGWGGMGYFVFPVWWLVALVVGGALGGLIDGLRRMLRSAPGDSSPVRSQTDETRE
jgi:hypothetical protein